MVVETVLKVVVQQFAERVIGRLIDPKPGDDNAKEQRRRQEQRRAQIEADLRAGIDKHAVEVANWSSHVHFYGMSRAEATGDSTLGLQLAEVPRRFRSSSMIAPSPETVSEIDLLVDLQHFIVLGDPGAGKTTTLKRLVRHLLHEPSLSNGDTWQFPLVAQLRDHPGEKSIAVILLEKLGLRNVMAADIASHIEALEKTGVEPVHLITDLGSLLSGLRLVVFLDGLDEVDIDDRPILETGIERLSRHLTTCKIVLSCRSGHYSRPIEGFATLEICSLTPDQIKQITQEWLPDRCDDFISQIQGSAAGELANRPLFLCQMVVLYRNTLSIPDQPWSLCRQMIRLMLQEWDEQRRIVRRSRYAHFGVDAKQDFLSALAFELTFTLARKRFDHAELMGACFRLSGRFLLPPQSYSAVASELETHTGILVQAGYAHYEFSHLSLQEYLAAEYLVKLPNQREIGRLYHLSPATVAVAVALSSEPATFFASVVSHAPLNATDQLRSFLTRLVAEQPRFEEGEVLGTAVLRVLMAYDGHDVAPFVGLVSQEAVRSSTAVLVDELYSWKEVSASDVVELVLVDAGRFGSSLPTPRRGRIPGEVFEILRR